jgi:hypothetical protein
MYSAPLEMLQLLKLNSSGVVMNYQFACSGISTVAAEHSSQNCKRAALLTLYVHIVVIAAVVFLLPLLLLFPPGCPFACPRCVWVVVPRHILVVPIHSLDSGIWVHSWYCWKFLCKATFIRANNCVTSSAITMFVHT